MRNASARKPVTPRTRNVPEDHRVLGLGLDADAVGALRRSGGRWPSTTPIEEQQPGDVADEGVGLVDRRRGGTWRPRGSWWSISRTVVTREQDQEAEVDQRVHDARRPGRAAGSACRRRPGSRASRAWRCSCRGGAAVVGPAPLPVAHPAGEQHGAEDEQHRDHRVEDGLHEDGMLPNTSRSIGESSCHWVIVARMPDPTVTRARAIPIATTRTWAHAASGQSAVVCAHARNLSAPRQRRELGRRGGRDRPGGRPTTDASRWTPLRRRRRRRSAGTWRSGPMSPDPAAAAGGGRWPRRTARREPPRPAEDGRRPPEPLSPGGART